MILIYLLTEKLGNLLSKFSIWKILSLWGSSISWSRGNRESDIDPTFHLAGQPIPITKCYTYLGIPFDKSLLLNPIIKLLNSIVTKTLFSVSKFLLNSKIPIPFKKL